MKNAILFFFFLLPFIVMAQVTASGPQKKDNLIIVSTDTVNRQALNIAARNLIDMGFTIREKNAKQGTITTDTYDYKKGKLTLNILISLNELRIWGEFEPNLALISGADKPNSLKDRINYEGNKESAVQDAWNIMDAYANQMSQILGGSIRYVKW